MMNREQEHIEANVALDDADAVTTMNKIGCCGWVRSELSCGSCCSHTTPMFGLIDPNGKRIDIEGSFGMNGTIISVATKFCFWALSIITLIYGWINNNHPYYFMAYLTQWTLLMTIIYFSCSLALSIMTLKSCSDNSDTSSGNSSSSFQRTLIKIGWGLFPIVSSAGAAVVLIYWLVVYDYENRGFPKYYSIMSHGIIFLLALADGFILNKIPLRLKHYMIVLLYGLTYIAWSIVAAAAKIDNPNTPSEDNSEALYTILDWDNEQTAATIVSVGVLFVALPVFTLFFWIVSVTCCRKYLEDEKVATDGSEQRDTTSVGENEDIGDVEAGQHVEANEAKAY